MSDTGQREAAERDEQPADPEIRGRCLAERPRERHGTDDADGSRGDHASPAEHRSEHAVQRAGERVRVFELEPRRQQQIEEPHDPGIRFVAGDPRRRDETGRLQRRDRRENGRGIVEPGALGVAHRELAQTAVAVEVLVDGDPLRRES